jgi:hypothetical protein
MAITDQSDSIQASMTDLARQYIARMLIGTFSFQAVGFSSGRGGYDQNDPVHILPLDTSLQALSDQVYPDTTGYTALQSIDSPSTTCRVYNCRMPNTPVPSNADYGLGEVAVWAQVLTSDVPSEIGTIFMLAVGHLPIRAKTNRDTFLWRVVVQY